MMTSYGWWLMGMTHSRLNWTHWSFCQVPEIRKIRIKWTSIRRRYDWSKLFSILRNYRLLEIRRFRKFRTIDDIISTMVIPGHRRFWEITGAYIHTASDWPDFEPIRRQKKWSLKNDEAITGTGQKWIWSKMTICVGLNFFIVSNIYESFHFLWLTSGDPLQVKWGQIN